MHLSLRYLFSLFLHPQLTYSFLKHYHTECAEISDLKSPVFIFYRLKLNLFLKQSLFQKHSPVQELNWKLHIYIFKSNRRNSSQRSGQRSSKSLFTAEISKTELEVVTFTSWKDKFLGYSFAMHWLLFCFSVPTVIKMRIIHAQV